LTSQGRSPLLFPPVHTDDGRPMVERLAQAVAVVRGRTTTAPRVGIVLGSGLGGFADSLSRAHTLPYREIPTMPISTVAGHAGELVLGELDSVPVAIMKGRVHLYEGHHPSEVVFGTRLLITLGVNTIVITNAAGGIAEELNAGDLMLIHDQLNLTGHNCLVGPNEQALGPRFPDMTTAYDPVLREHAHEAANKLGWSLKRGIYAGLLGPTYETPAEVRMLGTLGADAVGMSTVLETIAARHMGARVLGMSCITNLAAGRSGKALTHDEVQLTADAVKPKFLALLRKLIPALGAP